MELERDLDIYEGYNKQGQGQEVAKRLGDLQWVAEQGLRLAGTGSDENTVE